MKSIEKIILDEVFGGFMHKLPENDFTINQYIKAIKIYANQKLDETAEKATGYGYSGRIRKTVVPGFVNKQSILNLKDEL